MIITKIQLRRINLKKPLSYGAVSSFPCIREKENNTPYTGAVLQAVGMRGFAPDLGLLHTRLESYARINYLIMPSKNQNGE